LKSPHRTAGARPTPPGHLSKTSKALWNEVVAAFVLEPAALAILTAGLEARDRCDQAKAVVQEKGVVIVDRWGQLRTNPATTVERDSRAAFLHAMKQIGLDLPRP
jgi:P27 family predicted phage terminase small subunit